MGPNPDPSAPTDDLGQRPAPATSAPTNSLWSLFLVLASYVVFLAISIIGYWSISVQFDALTSGRGTATRERLAVHGVDWIEAQMKAADLRVRLYLFSGDLTQLDDIEIATDTTVADNLERLRQTLLDRYPVGDERVAALQRQSALEQSVKNLLSSYHAAIEQYPRLVRDPERIRQILADNKLALNNVLRDVNQWRDAETSRMRRVDLTQEQQLKKLQRNASWLFLIGTAISLTLSALLIIYVRRRQEVERKLADTTDVLQDVQQSVVQGIAVFDSAGCLQLFNQQYLDLIKVRPERRADIKVGVSIDAIVRAAAPRAEGNVEHFANEAINYFKRRPFVEQSIERNLSDGSAMVIIRRPMRGERMVETIMDVTPLRSALKQAKSRADWLGGLMNNISQGIAVYDQAGVLISFNPRYLELAGMPADRIRIGMSFREALLLSLPIEGTDMSELAAQEMAIFSNPELRTSATFEVTRVDQTVLQIKSTMLPDGHVMYMLTDVTEIRKSERQARDRATRLNAIMNSVHDAIVTINASGSIESWSAGAQSIFGYTEVEILRRSVRVLMSDGDGQAHEHGMHRYLKTGESKMFGRRIEMLGRRKNGELFPIDLIVSEMYIDNQPLFVGIIRDITERRSVEKMKDEFISTVSHELRTPLTSISGALSLLAHDPALRATAKTSRLVEIAERNSERLTLLINDLLDLEKIESGNVEIKADPADLIAVLQQSIDATRTYARQQKLRYETRFEMAECVVLMDAARTAQVMANLLSNASKYSPVGGVVLVHAAIHDQVVRVTVHDDGPGIPVEFQKRLFTRFAQADATDTRQKSGTGLGLAISKSLIERMGGRIGYASGRSAIGAGQGASFWFELPLAQQPELVGTGEGGPAARAGLTGRILICEDDTDIQQVLRQMLEKMGCQVMACSCVVDAIRTLSAESFDLLVTDINLPDDNGLSLIARLRADTRFSKLPVVVVSALSPEHHRQQISGLNVLDWLAKPIDTNRLHAAIRLGLSGIDTAKRVPAVLYVEDDADIAESVAMLLSGRVEVVLATSLAVAVDALTKRKIDLCLLDMQLPDGNGVALLALMADRHIPVVIYSASEVSADIASQVAAALVKSRDSLHTLQATLQRFLHWHDQSAVLQ